MNFLNSEQTLSEAQILQCETALGLRFPQALRESFLAANGGEPEPYVFQNDDLDTIVSEFLPLVSESRGTAVRAYERLVAGQRLVPSHFFPFAVDGGGDYFFTDTHSADGAVYFYRSDSEPEERLLALNLGLVDFWAALRPE